MEEIMGEKTIITDTVKKKYKDWIIYAILLIVIYLFAKIHRKYLLSGVDIEFHKYRLAGLIQSIKEGDLFPKINYLMGSGHGYGVPMFYGQWWMYLPALFIIGGMSYTKAWLTTECAIYFVAFVLNYKIARKFSQNRERAILISIIFIFNPLCTQIMNGDIPFAICLYIFPIILYLIYKVMYLENYNPILLGVFAGVIVKTHVVSTVIVIICIGIYFIVDIKKITAKKIISFTVSGCLAILISASYLFPMIEQMYYQKFAGTATGDTFRYYSVHKISEIIINSFQDLQLSLSKYPQISLAGIILLIVIMINWRQQSRYSNRLLVVTLLVIFMSSSSFPWVIFSKTPLGIVQFTGRYLVFAMAIIMLIAMSNTSINRWTIRILVIIVFSSNLTYGILPDITNQESINTFESIDYYTAVDQELSIQNLDFEMIINQEKSIDGVSGGEYYNECADAAEISADLTLEPRSDSVELFDVDTGYNYIKFDYEGTGEIVVPRIWYKGYTAQYIDGEEGSQPKLDTDNNGYISIDVDGSGTVSIQYEKTLIQKISLAVTAITVIGLFVVLNPFIKERWYERIFARLKKSSEHMD